MSHGPPVIALDFKSGPSNLSSPLNISAPWSCMLPHLIAIPNSGMIIPTVGAIRSRRSTPKSLADALFTKTQQRVLRVLFGQSERSFYASELIREAGTGSGAAQRELARLERSGIIVARRIGNQKHYRANAGSPLFRNCETSS